VKAEDGGKKLEGELAQVCTDEELFCRDRAQANNMM
jgi:hypothetical protein